MKPRKTQMSCRSFISICLACPALLASFMAIAGLSGCGGSTAPDCTTATALSISSSSATADHTAAAPGNQVQFAGVDRRPSGCVLNAFLIQRTDLKWTVSDAANVTIGNTLNVDYGMATCVNATPAPVTVTASGLNAKGATITGTSTLTCR